MHKPRSYSLSTTNGRLQVLTGLKIFLTSIILLLNTLFFCPILIFLAFVKLITPISSWRHQLGLTLITIANAWIRGNNLTLSLTQNIEWEIKCDQQFDPAKWYFVISNHQSWFDIIVLQKVFIDKIPFLRFFLKEQLRYVPILGLCWWALDFPFMKRYSKKALAENPHLSSVDVNSTRKSCERFKLFPSSITNFLEGTRFTLAKRDSQNSPYKMLLRPKAGGFSRTLEIMGEQMDTIVDVTLFYPDGNVGFIDLLAGKIKKVVVVIKAHKVTPELIGDYTEDEKYKLTVQQFVNDLWKQKDDLLAKLHLNAEK